MLKTLPFFYSLRNLGRSPLRLAMSLLGCMLVVILVIIATSFIRGMENSLAQSGSENNVIFLSAGSEESIERSEISASSPSHIAAGITGLQNKLSVSYVSPEVHMALGVSMAENEKAQHQTIFRGVKSEAFLVHPQVRMLSGRMFNPGADEIIVGRQTHTRLKVEPERLAIGNRLWIDGQPFEIVGEFTAPNTMMDAEIWIPLTNLQILTKRDSLSCVIATLDEAEFSDADLFTRMRLDLELIVMRESAYYTKLIDFYRPVRMMVWITAALIAIGGIFGGLNTMYAAFAARIREIGMLQSLGYSRRSVIWSFMQESLIAAAAGSLLGCVFCLILIDGHAIRFSMGAFGLAIDSVTILFGLLAGFIVGLLGALPPMIRCMKLPIQETLKAN